VEGVETVVRQSFRETSDACTREIVRCVESLPAQTIAEVRQVRRNFSKRLNDSDAEFVVQIALKLIAKDRMLLRFVAYELVLHHRAASASLGIKTVERLGKGIDSWAAVDTFACYISGPAWREHLVSDSMIVKWTHSRDRWWRRAAVVSTVPLNNNARGGKGDTKRTLQVCSLVVDDRDDMIVKALSWSLRELSKKDAPAVERFIAKHESRLAPRVLREVGNKLATGLKNPKRRRS